MTAPEEIIIYACSGAHVINTKDACSGLAAYKALRERLGGLSEAEQKVVDVFGNYLLSLNRLVLDQGTASIFFDPLLRTALKELKSIEGEKRALEIVHEIGQILGREVETVQSSIDETNRQAARLGILDSPMSGTLRNNPSSSPRQRSWLQKLLGRSW